MKKILLINDTGMMANPGCRVVRSGYDVLFDGEKVKAKIIDSIPVHYWTNNFRDISIRGGKSIVFNPGEFPTYNFLASDIDFLEWERIRKKALKNDFQFNEKLEKVDLVVVNGEGSIHHNSVQALSVLALAKSAVERGVETILLNSTVMAMMPSLIKDVFPMFQFVNTRDIASSDFLKLNKISSHVSTDIAFLGLSEKDIYSDSYERVDNYVLVTAGVTARKESLSFIFSRIFEMGMKPNYLVIGDGGELTVANEICSKFDVEIINSKDFTLLQLIEYIKKFKLAISGRHHINLFLMQAGIAFLPLCSNTWKIQESLKLVNYPYPVVETFKAFSNSLNGLISERSKISKCSRDSYIKGVQKLDEIILELSKCI